MNLILNNFGKGKNNDKFKKVSKNDNLKSSTKLLKVENDAKIETKNCAKDCYNKRKSMDSIVGGLNTKINNCHKSEKNFHYRSKLDDHFRIHSRIENRDSLKSKQDNINGKIFTSDLDKNHNLANNLECKFCGKISRDKSKHNVHIGMHIKKLKYPCKECEESFEHLVNLARHISIIHRKHNPSKIECPICKKMVSAINAHLRSHQDSPIDCELCGATLKNYYSYVAHKRFHKILLIRGVDRTIIPKHLKELNLKCLQCNTLFKCRRQLVSHLQRHISVTCFPCPYCQEESSSPENLIKHVSNVHKSIPEGFVQCPHCNMIVSNIKTHLKSHQFNLICCDMCDDVTFTHQASYWKHFNKKHRINKMNRVIFIGRCFKVEDVSENELFNITSISGLKNTEMRRRSTRKKFIVLFANTKYECHT